MQSYLILCVCVCVCVQLINFLLSLSKRTLIRRYETRKYNSFFPVLFVFILLFSPSRYQRIHLNNMAHFPCSIPEMYQTALLPHIRRRLNPLRICIQGALGIPANFQLTTNFKVFHQFFVFAFEMFFADKCITNVRKKENFANYKFPYWNFTTLCTNIICAWTLVYKNKSHFILHHWWKCANAKPEWFWC